MMEMKTILSHLFRNIDLSSIDKVEDVKPIMELVVKPMEEIRAIFKAR